MSRGTVIVYHGVGDVAPERDPYHLLLPQAAFEWQMAYLARHRRVVPLEAIVEDRLPRGRPLVAITFDDGYRSVREIAAPILLSHGFPATLFVPTRWLGQEMGWEPMPGPAVPLGIMTAEEIAQCGRDGFEIGSHGHAHAHMARLSPEDASADLTASVDCLTDLLGRRPRYVAYPWGEHSAAVRAAAQRAGVEAGFSINQVAAGPYARERVAIRRSDGRAVFAAKTSGRYLDVRMSLLPRAALRLGMPLLDWYRRRH